MNKSLFNEKVKKQLWFLNSKEEKQLNERLIQKSGNENVDYNKPIKFSNQYLKRYVFKEKSVTSSNVFLILIVIIVVYALLLGLFLLGLITSLTAVHYFIVPKVQLSGMLVLLIIIFAIMIMIVSLFAIKQVTALFTKKILEYKFNKK